MRRKHWIIITILWTAFIFTQSLLPGDISSNQSGFIVDVFYPWITKLGINISVNAVGFYIRKLAHFTEYFILGTFLFFMYRNKIKYPLFVFIHGLITASIDESIQLITPNRSGEVRDVLIDITGVMIGMLMIGVLYKLKKK